MKDLSLLTQSYAFISSWHFLLERCKFSIKCFPLFQNCFSAPVAQNTNTSVEEKAWIGVLYNKYNVVGISEQLVAAGVTIEKLWPGIRTRDAGKFW